MPYSIRTNAAIQHVMSMTKKNEVLDSYQITDLIKKTFGKKERYETVGRQLRRMTNEESFLYPWLERVGDNRYTYVSNPVSLYNVLEEKTFSLKDVSSQELLNELKKRLKR